MLQRYKSSANILIFFNNYSSKRTFLKNVNPEGTDLQKHKLLGQHALIRRRNKITEVAILR